MISFFQSFSVFVQICFYILPGNEDFNSCQMIEKIPVSKVIFQSLRMSLLTSHFQSPYNKEETGYKCNHCILLFEDAYAIMPVGQKIGLVQYVRQATKTPERLLRGFLFLFLTMGRLNPIGWLPATSYCPTICR